MFVSSYLTLPKRSLSDALVAYINRTAELALGRTPTTPVVERRLGIATRIILFMDPPKVA